MTSKTSVTLTKNEFNRLVSAKYTTGTKEYDNRIATIIIDIATHYGDVSYVIDKDECISQITLNLWDYVESGKLDVNQNPYNYLKKRAHWLRQNFAKVENNNPQHTPEFDDNTPTPNQSQVSAHDFDELLDAWRNNWDVDTVEKELKCLIIEVISSKMPPSKRNRSDYYRAICLRVWDDLEDNIMCYDDLLTTINKYYELRNCTTTKDKK